jgi:hypothetical protein
MHDTAISKGQVKLEAYQYTIPNIQLWGVALTVTLTGGAYALSKYFTNKTSFCASL